VLPAITDIFQGRSHAAVLTRLLGDDQPVLHGYVCAPLMGAIWTGWRPALVIIGAVLGRLALRVFPETSMRACDPVLRSGFSNVGNIMLVVVVRIPPACDCI